MQENYSYDNRGNMKSGMLHLYTGGDSLYYNEENRLEKVALMSGSTVYYIHYQYDYNGQRVRSSKEGFYTEVRRYVGQWELYRKILTSTGVVNLERETLHVMDDMARVAIIDTPIGVSGEDQTLRYQFSNNLGTATLELDGDANIISYEEYYPFGNTSYQAGRTTAEVQRKRYRYIGKERDDETGLYYIRARYYCPWLLRWMAPEPINSEYYNMDHGQPGRNLERQFVELTASSYEYCYDNPVRFSNPSGEQAPGRRIKAFHDDAARVISTIPSNALLPPPSPTPSLQEVTGLLHL